MTNHLVPVDKSKDASNNLQDNNQYHGNQILERERERERLID